MGLAARGYAADDKHERQPRLPGESFGDRQQPARLRACVAVRGTHGGMLGGSHEQDLGAHQCPVDRKERHQRAITGIAARGAVGVKQLGREPLASECRQVHDQEREVVGDIQRSQLRIELHAVYDTHRPEQHMLGAQITVAPSRAAARRARIEQPPARRDERRHEPRQIADMGALASQRRHPEQLLDVAVNLALDPARSVAPAADGLAARVEVRQRPRDPHQVLASQLAAIERRRERAALVVAAHLDQILDRAPVVGVGQVETVGGLDHAANAEVDVRGQLPVETDLREAHRAPLLGGTVIEERQHERLLALIRSLRGQEHP